MCPPPDSPHASLAGRLPSEGHAHRYAGNSGVMEALRARVSLCVWWQGSWIAGMVCNGGKGRGSQVWCTRNMGGGLMHVSSGCVLSCMYKCAVNGREAIAVIY
jgi:hypothetical protein